MADKRKKERGKLVALEALLRQSKFRALRATSRHIHFYVETSDVLEEGFSRVLPYLDFLTDDQGGSLEQLIDNLVSRARSAPVLAEVQIEACQRYLELVCGCRGWPALAPLAVAVARSKIDQGAAGQIVGVASGTPTCPVAALRIWLEAADITNGAVFRSHRSMAELPPTCPTEPSR